MTACIRPPRRGRNRPARSPAQRSWEPLPEPQWARRPGRFSAAPEAGRQREPRVAPPAGLIRGLFHPPGRDLDPEQRRLVEQCLRDKGYDVSWLEMKVIYTIIRWYLAIISIGYTPYLIY